MTLTLSLTLVPTAEADTKPRFGCSASSPVDEQPGVIDTRVGARCDGHLIVPVIFCLATDSYS